MIRATDSEWAPWYAVRSDDKKRARLNVITHFLSQVPYEAPAHEKATLPRRDAGESPQGSVVELRFIPTPF
jgi:hypothetical protein